MEQFRGTSSCRLEAGITLLVVGMRCPFVEMVMTKLGIMPVTAKGNCHLMAGCAEWGQRRKDETKSRLLTRHIVTHRFGDFPPMDGRCHARELSHVFPIMSTRGKPQSRRLALIFCQGSYLLPKGKVEDQS
jgi:hypothetical protein